MKNPGMQSRGFPALSKVRSGLVVAAEDADHHTLHADAIGLDDAGFHGAVGGLEADLAAFLEPALEGGLAAVEEGDDLLAVLGRLAALDDDVVAVAKMVVDHRLAADAEDVDTVARLKHRLEVDLLAV